MSELGFLAFGLPDEVDPVEAAQEKAAAIYRINKELNDRGIIAFAMKADSIPEVEQRLLMREVDAAIDEIVERNLPGDDDAKKRVVSNIFKKFEASKQVKAEIELEQDSMPYGDEIDETATDALGATDDSSAISDENQEEEEGGDYFCDDPSCDCQETGIPHEGAEEALSEDDSEGLEGDDVDTSSFSSELDPREASSDDDKPAFLSDDEDDDDDEDEDDDDEDSEDDDDDSDDDEDDDDSDDEDDDDKDEDKK